MRHPLLQAMRSLVLSVPALIVLGIGTVLALMLGGSSATTVVVSFYINLILVIGLQMFMGNSGIDHFGHAAFMAIGAYTAALFAAPTILKRAEIPNAPFSLASVQLSVSSAIGVGLVVTAVCAAVAGVVVVRQAGMAASIITVILLVLVQQILLNWVSLTRGPSAFYGIPIVVSLPSAIGGGVFAVLVGRVFRDSSWGLQLRASSYDEVAAAGVGVRLRRVRLLGWVLGSTIVGLGGALFAFTLGTISPSDFYWNIVFLTMAMLVIGGKGSVSGSVVGSFVVTAGVQLADHLETKITSVTGLDTFFIGGVILLTMIMRPTGILGDDELDEIALRLWRARQVRMVAERPENGSRSVGGV